ncbi:Rho termination factor N-terminal domain-containing protein, partial [Kocuria flava]|uniref:Rho termination factor N-terminal domain-containing protein n=1 Tax=Kocuria flava TaxID=446860 RepID=UPI002F956487
MTDTTDLSTGTDETTADPRSAGLSALKLAQLQALASQLGITGARRMRKSLLVDAIAAHQRGGAVADRDKAVEEKIARTVEKTAEKAETRTDAPAETTPAVEQPARRSRSRRAGSDGVVAAEAPDAPAERTPQEAPEGPTGTRGEQAEGGAQGLRGGEDRSGGDQDGGRGRGRGRGRNGQDQQAGQDNRQGGRQDKGGQDQQGGRQDKGGQDQQGGRQDKGGQDQQ